jgi:hypothetical protein
MRTAELVFWKTAMISVAPMRPRPTVNMPATAPVRKATLSAAGIEPFLAAAAVRTLPRTARLMPMKPVRPDAKQPSRKATVRTAPETPWLIASAPVSLLVIAVDVMNTMTTRGTRMTAIVRNWRLR